MRDMCGARRVAARVALALLLAAARAHDVTVVRQTLTFGLQYTFTLNSSIEYILDYVPSGDEGAVPSRVWVSSEGGDTAQPVLVTARQAAGAVTWQLPYLSGARLLHALERTLCPPDSAAPTGAADNTTCAEEGEGAARGAFSLHLGSACAAPVAVTVRAQVATDWRLGFQATTGATISLESPRVYLYQFEEEQQNVRLVVDSQDDVCAVISVQQYLCPIQQTVTEVETMSVRMTIEQSGATQVSRDRFPQGFYVVALVRHSDLACNEEVEVDEDWLWEAAMWGDQHHALNASARIKNLSIRIEPALTLRQYVAASATTLAVFAAFYLGFFITLLARRWPPFARLVEPKAVLADSADPGGGGGGDGRDQTAGPGADAAFATSRRRGSDATYDSSDMSDSDEEQGTDATAATPETAMTPDLVMTPEMVRTPGTRRSPADVEVDDTDAPNHFSVDVAGQHSDVAGQMILDARTLHPTSNETPPIAVVSGASANGGVGDGVGGVGTPFGLPARLRLAALARRRDRVLRARSDRYLYTLLTVAVFYALPVVQFVAAFQIIMNVWGSLDLCYYNFLCAHPVGGLSDFNHVFSNLGYLLLGALFVLQVHARRTRRAATPTHQEFGIPPHYGMLMSLGVCMMMVAVLSATYHVCPNRLNFQFDTAFMYVLAVLSMVKIYQSRHPDVNARAHVTFGVLAVLIAMVVWGVLGGGALFWSLFTVLHLFTFLLLSLRIYYLGQFRLEKERLASAARELRARGARSLRPLYTARLVMLLVANAANWAFALYGLLTQQTDFATHLLQVLLGNTLLHMVFYLVMKLVHGERPRWYAWCWLGGAAAAWVPALYFFLAGSTNWAATPARSRHRNHECQLLRFYDNHDLWHMLSAVALYFSFNAMLTWDDGLAAVNKADIPVF